MEKKVSKNIGDLLILSSKNFFHSFGRSMLGTLVFLLPFLVCGAMCIVFQAVWAYVTFSMIVCVIYGPMHVGYTKYCSRLYAGEKPCVLSIFKGFASKYVAFFALFGFILLMLYALGLVLFIFPVLIVIAFFSMTTFYIAKYDYHYLGVLKTCYVRMRRNRITMMSYKAVFYLLFLMFFVLGGLSGFGVYAISAYSVSAAVVAGVIAGIILLFIFCALVSYYHATNHLQFEEIEVYYERKQKRLAAKNGEVQEEPAKVEEVKEEKVEEPVQEVKKTTRTRKTTTKE